MLRNLRVAWFIALRSTRRGDKASIALIVLIVSLAFVSLTFIAAILTGIVDTINQQVTNTVVSNIVVSPQEEPERKDFIVHAAGLQKQIEEMPGVVATARRYKLSGMMAYDKNGNGKFKRVYGEIYGIEPEREKLVSIFAKKVIEGRYLDDLDRDQILLGAALAGGQEAGAEVASLEGAQVGDKVRVSFSNGVTREYKVKGIFKTQFEMADRLAFVTLKEAEGVLGVQLRASQVLVRTNKIGLEDALIPPIQEMDPDLKVRKWTEHVGLFESVSQSFAVINFIIGGISLAVAAISMFVLIYVNVVSRKRQIGILKAIGIRQNIIVYSYVLQSGFYAISGLAVGLLLLLYFIAPYFAAHPLNLPMGETRMSIESGRLVNSVLSLMLAALVAGLIPSWRAARQNVLKAIWGA